MAILYKGSVQVSELLTSNNYVYKLHSGWRAARSLARHLVITGKPKEREILTVNQRVV